MPACLLNAASFHHQSRRNCHADRGDPQEHVRRRQLPRRSQARGTGRISESLHSPLTHCIASRGQTFLRNKIVSSGPDSHQPTYLRDECRGSLASSRTFPSSPVPSDILAPVLHADSGGKVAGAVVPPDDQTSSPPAGSLPSPRPDNLLNWRVGIFFPPIGRHCDERQELAT